MSLCGLRLRCTLYIGRAIPVMACCHASHAALNEFRQDVKVLVRRHGFIDFVNASASIRAQSQSTTARPHRARTQDCSSGHSHSTMTVSAPQAQFSVFYPGPSWALLRSGARPNSCSQTPRHVSSSFGTGHATPSWRVACLSSHIVRISGDLRVPLHSGVHRTRPAKWPDILASRLRKRS